MKKRIILWMLITPLGLILLLVASWYTFCFWVNSWRNIEPPPCHESWSQEQCADLMEIDNELRNNSAIAGLTYFYEGELSPTTKWLREKKWGMIPAMLLGWRELCVPARAALHETMRSFVDENTTFEELFYFINDQIKACGYVNLDFLGNLGHSIVKDKNQRIYIEKGNTEKLSAVEAFTFEPHISLPGSIYGFKKENIYCFRCGVLKEL